MRFCGLSLADAVPDANTLRDFREHLVRAGAFEALFARLDALIKEAGYLSMGGQIVDASLVAAPRPRNTEAEKSAIKAGKSAAEIWPDDPAKAAQKDVDARWTVKSSKGKPDATGKPRADLAIPEFGYKSHVGIDVVHGFIRRQMTTDAAAHDAAAHDAAAHDGAAHDAAAHDGARLREGLLDPANTASGVWADTAYRSGANEAFLKQCGKRSQIHRKKPSRRPMAQRTARANAKKSKVRAKVEHVFAQQKARMNLQIRSIGKARAAAIIAMANIAYNLGRWRWSEEKTIA